MLCGRVNQGDSSNILTYYYSVVKRTFLSKSSKCGRHAFESLFPRKATGADTSPCFLSRGFARVLILLLFCLFFLFFYFLFLTLVLILLAFVSHCVPLFPVVPHLLAARTPLWREFCLWVLSRFQLPSTTLSNPFDSLYTNIS